MTEPDDGPWEAPTEHDDPPAASLAVARDATSRDATSRDTAAGAGPDRSGAAGRIAIVATGIDADRVRRLCHGGGLLVPVVSSLSAVDDAVSAIVIGEPAPPAPERVVHVARPTMADDILLALLRALCEARVLADPPVASGTVDQRTSSFAQRLDELDERAAIERLGREAIAALAVTDRAHVLFHDPSSGALWSEAERSSGVADRRTTGGIVGWCALTGHAVHASPAGDDPRYVTELDDPEGKAQSRLLVQPVIGAGRRVHALLVAVRRWRRSDFTDAECTALRDLAASIAPAIERARGGAGGTRRSRPTLPRGAAQTTVAVATPGKPDAVTVPASEPESPAGPTSPSEPESPAGPTSPSELPAALRAKQPTEPPPGARPRRPSEAPRAKRPSIDGSEPRDVAIVATGDDATRADKVARKARLGISVLSSAEEVPPYYRIVMLGGTWTQDSDPRVAYVARSTLTDEQLSELLVGVTTDHALAAPVSSKPLNATEARRVQLALASARELATAPDLAGAESIATRAIRALVDAERAYCLYFDPDDGSLWSEARERERGDERRALAGITGWAARTGRAVHAPRGAGDPRWLAPLDDPDGDPNSQLLVQPIITGDRRVLGVMVAARRAKRPGFSDLDIAVLARFAALAAPLLDQHELAADIQHVLGEHAPSDEERAAIASPLQRLARGAQRLPRWFYAVAGAALALAIGALARW